MTSWRPLSHRECRIKRPGTFLLSRLRRSSEQDNPPRLAPHLIFRSRAGLLRSLTTGRQLRVGACSDSANCSVGKNSPHSSTTAKSFEPGIRRLITVHRDRAWPGSECFTGISTPSRENRVPNRCGGQSHNRRPSGERSRTGVRASDASRIARHRPIAWSGCIHRQRHEVGHEVELRDNSLIGVQGHVASAGSSTPIDPADEGRACCWGRRQ
jgi:hypothetical protein